MRLRVICQICGRRKVIRTEKPIGPEPRWTQFRLGDIIPEDYQELRKLYAEDRVWVCPECMSKAIEEWEEDWDEFYGMGYFPIYDWDKLKEMILESLEIKRG